MAILQLRAMRGWSKAETARRFFGNRPGESISSGFSAMFTNTVLIGIPIMQRAYGEAAMPTVFSIIAEQIAWERWEGTLEYTMMAPVRRASQLLGSNAFAVIYGLIHTTVVLAALVLFFGLDLSHADFGAAAVFMLLGSLSVIGIGMMAAVLPLIYVERGAQMTFVLQSLLLLISGVYYSVTILPDWMQLLAAFSPFTYVLEGVRQALIDGVPITELWHLVWPLIVMAVVFIPAGVWVFRRAEHYAKRTGKLKRVG